MYRGDIAANQSLRWAFTTQFSGLSTSLLIPTMAVYQDANTTETVTGITLVTDFDGRTGLNSVVITATGSFYATGHDYFVVITTGTVGGVSAAGYVVGTFSIQNRYGGAGGGLDAAGVRSAVGLASANLDTQLSDIQSDTDNIQTRIPTALTANGNMKSSLVEILTTALTETAGQIAAAFKKLFDVATPVLTAASVNQTGDSYARLGAPAGGVSISADIASLPTTGDLMSDAELRSAMGLASANLDTQLSKLDVPISSRQPTGTVVVGTNNDKTGYTLVVTPPTSVQIDTQLSSSHGTGTWGGSGGGLDAAGVRSAIGLASANLDTQLSKLDVSVSSRQPTGTVVVGTNNDKSGYTLVVTPPTAAQVDTQLSSSHGTGSWQTGGGLDAAGIRGAVGLASANLDTQLSSIPTNPLLTNDARLNDLDAKISSRMMSGTVVVATNNDKTGYTLLVTPPTVGQIDNQLTSVHGSGTWGGSSGGLDAAGVRSAVGLASANLDSQLTRLDVPISSRQPTGTVVVGTNNDKSGYTLTVTPPTKTEVAAEVLLEAQTTPIESNVKKVNDVDLQGTGVLGDEWGPVP